LLAREAPDVLVALGGWPCVPAVLAARTKRIPVAFLASDAKPGVAVRRLAGWAARIYVAHESAARELGERAQVVVTGPVIRRRVLEAQADHAGLGLDPERLTLFVTGGSLGARALNEALPRGIAAAVRRDPTLRDRLQVLHQVGESGEGVATAYEAAGVSHRVVRFVEDVGGAYRAAQLVVARGGALTCAELAAVGVPAVLVPYPHHADRQQFENARTLAAAGAARVVEEHELTEEGVRRILDLLEDAEARREMKNALGAEDPDAAGQIAADLIRLVGYAQGRDGAR
jgi:UDP-N-acetylglucosamine--N-acetylmuramyl-(pentapeptide) pyrophosphoryl-undecaprenol N-acetylglucosamine transferase